MQDLSLKKPFTENNIFANLFFLPQVVKRKYGKIPKGWVLYLKIWRLAPIDSSAYVVVERTWERMGIAATWIVQTYSGEPRVSCAITVS